MIAQILSDLHLEFSNGRIELPFVPHDVLILAGDIHLGTQADQFIVTQLEYSDVIYVLGNHEFYNQVLPDVRWAWNDLTAKRINKQAAMEGFGGKLHMLDDKAVTIGDVTFIGATLWTDFNDGNPISMNEARLGMNDYRIITATVDKDDWPHKIPIQPEDTLRLHNKSRYFIESELAKPGKKVLITHHLPSYQSISEGFQGSPLNPAYASNLDDWFYDYEDVVLAVHGHTHQSFNYLINNTPVICNPRGYFPNDINPLFDPELCYNIT